MRFLIFSDLHGNQYAWRAFLKIQSSLSYDSLVFLGDVFGYYYGQNEILQGLSEQHGLIWLLGNHDKFFLKILHGEMEADKLVERYGSTYLTTQTECAWAEEILEEKGFTHILETGGKRILFCHGTPSNAEAGRLYPKDPWSPADCGDYDVVVCGHTHFRMIRAGEGRLWLNAGSLGQPRDGSHSGVLIYDTDSNTYEYVNLFYDKSQLLRDIERNDSDLEKLKEILTRERDE